MTTIAAAWEQQDSADRTVESLSELLELPYIECDDAIRYWAEHRHEIDTLLTLHRETQDAALTEWQRRQNLGAD